MTITACIDARDALRNANIAATDSGHARVVAYIKGEGWVHYDPVRDAAIGEPEMLALGQGRIPLPLSEHASDVWLSAIRAEAAHEADHARRVCRVADALSRK